MGIWQGCRGPECQIVGGLRVIELLSHPFIVHIILFLLLDLSSHLLFFWSTPILSALFILDIDSSWSILCIFKGVRCPEPFVHLPWSFLSVQNLHISSEKGVGAVYLHIVASIPWFKWKSVYSFLKDSRIYPEDWLLYTTHLTAVGRLLMMPSALSAYLRADKALSPWKPLEFASAPA